MHEFPHHYRVSGASDGQAPVRLSSAQLPTLETAPPPEFGGPGGFWSPETLLCAAVADCFILSFHAVARASKLEWEALECNVEGRLERVEGVTRFTHFDIRADLKISDPERRSLAERCLEKAEKSCLITNSLVSTKSLHADIEVTETQG